MFSSTALTRHTPSITSTQKLQLIHRTSNAQPLSHTGSKIPVLPTFPIQYHPPSRSKSASPSQPPLSSSQVKVSTEPRPFVPIQRPPTQRSEFVSSLVCVPALPVPGLCPPLQPVTEARLFPPAQDRGRGRPAPQPRCDALRCAAWRESAAAAAAAGGKEGWWGCKDRAGQGRAGG